MLGLLIDPPVLFTSGACVSAVCGLKIGPLVHIYQEPHKGEEAIYIYIYYLAVKIKAPEHLSTTLHD